jgi:DNA-binding transcriptional LysR family regulator
MTLDQLRIFVAVAEQQHVTRAAQTLNLTQSAVSGAIAALEARHGVRLFDRVGRGIVLNAVGQTLLSDAKAILGRVAGAEATLADLSALRRGRLTVQASQTIASYWLPKRLVAFHAAHPGIEIDLRFGNTLEAAEAVLRGDAELGYVEGEIEDPALKVEPVGEDRLVLLTKADHPWARRSSLTADHLLAENWVLREAGSGTRSSLEAALGEKGVAMDKLKVALTLPSNEAVLAAAEAGAGVAALSESVAERSLARGALVRAPLKLPTRTYRLLRHNQRSSTHAAVAFTTLVQQFQDRPKREDYTI